MAKEVCAVCGQGGYWVGYDPTTREQRCVNHVGPHANVGSQFTVKECADAPAFIRAEPQPMGSVQGDAKLSGNSGIGDGAHPHERE